MWLRPSVYNGTNSIGGDYHTNLVEQLLAEKKKYDRFVILVLLKMVTWNYERLNSS